MSADAFNFFHWVDCEKSKPVSGYPAGFLFFLFLGIILKLGSDKYKLKKY